MAQKNPKKKSKRQSYTSESAAVQIVAGLLMCGLGLLVVLSLHLNMPGDVYASVRKICYGAFGLPSMLLPLFFVWGGVLLIIATRRKVRIRSFVYAFVLYLLLLAVFELIVSTGEPRQSLYDYFKTHDKVAINFGEYLGNAYGWSAAKHSGGGVVGMLVGFPLQQFLGPIVTAVLYVFIMIALTLFMVRFDFKGFGAKVSAWRAHSKEKAAAHREEKRIAAEKQAAEAAKSQQESRVVKGYDPNAQQEEWQEFAPSSGNSQSLQPVEAPRGRGEQRPKRTSTPYGFKPTKEELTDTHPQQPLQPHQAPGTRGSSVQGAKPRKLRLFGNQDEAAQDENLDAYRRPSKQAPVQPEPQPQRPPELDETGQPVQPWQSRTRPAVTAYDDRPAARDLSRSRRMARVEDEADEQDLRRAEPVRPGSRMRKPMPSWSDEGEEAPVETKPFRAGDIRVPVVDKNAADSYKPELRIADTPDEEDTFGERAAKRRAAAAEATPYVYPDVSMLRAPQPASDVSPEEDAFRARRLEETLASFRVEAKVVHITHGPAISRFELELGPGINVNKVTNLGANISMNMEVKSVRIEAPIPGKSLVGIEVPNRTVSTVTLREVLESEPMAKATSTLTVALGKDIAGTPIVCNLAKMPHLLIAGATGSGKSVCINTMINSLLYRASPNEVRMILIDPKVVELQCYNGIPHLLIPVVSDPHKASSALAWAVAEMMDRYKKFELKGVRAIDGFNSKLGKDDEYMPRIVIIIDELADLMMTCKREVEDHICRLAQLARAAGIHLVVATQRPSVDVITGLIKANIPSRIAFKVTSYIDSRTILDKNGAEQLLGWGDMLYQPTGEFTPMRIQGCFLSDEEVNDITDFVRERCPGVYDPDVMEKLDQLSRQEESGSASIDDFADDDASDSDKNLLQQAIEMAVRDGQVSTSLIQRRLKIGYARAGRLVDEMEKRGIVSAKDGAKPRMCLISHEEYQLLLDEGTLDDE